MTKAVADLLWLLFLLWVVVMISRSWGPSGKLPNGSNFRLWKRRGPGKEDKEDGD